jgi:hypothetical protein
MEVADVYDVLGGSFRFVVFVVKRGHIIQECSLEMDLTVYRDTMGLDFVE